MIWIEYKILLKIISSHFYTSYKEESDKIFSFVGLHPQKKFANGQARTKTLPPGGGNNLASLSNINKF